MTPNVLGSKGLLRAVSRASRQWLPQFWRMPCVTPQAFPSRPGNHHNIIEVLAHHVRRQPTAPDYHVQDAFHQPVIVPWTQGSSKHQAQLHKPLIKQMKPLQVRVFPPRCTAMCIYASFQPILHIGYPFPILLSTPTHLAVEDMVAGNS